MENFIEGENDLKPHWVLNPGILAGRDDMPQTNTNHQITTFTI